MAQSRNKAELERDRRNISRMYLKGALQAEIAAELGISQSTVSRDITFLQKEWQEARINDIDERKRLELARIDNLELEYWDAWKRSQQNAEIETMKRKGTIVETEQGETRNITPVEGTKRVEGQVGDARFLDGVMKCINKRCELLGLDAPTKVAPTNPDGNKPYESITDEGLNRAVSSFYDAVREAVSGKDTKETG